jgi:large subunit ribosomal protein L18
MKSAAKQKRIKREIRHNRVRSRVFGTATMPRLNVFKASAHIYVQAIDDSAGKTLVSASSKEIKIKGKKTEIASAVGKLVAEKALAKGIKQIVFDRGGYAYHGRVKALAEAAREGGLKF